MKNDITLFDERNKELRVGDLLVLITKEVDMKVSSGSWGQEVKVVGRVEPPTHGKILSMEKLSDGFAEIGPTIEVTLDNGVKFELDGENGSTQHAWYKLSE